MSKRGQITIFIIVGLVILGYIFFTFVFKDSSNVTDISVSREAISASEMSPIKSYYSSCMQDQLNSGVLVVGLFEGDLNKYLQGKVDECTELVSAQNPDYKFTRKTDPYVDTTYYKDNIVYVDIKPNVLVSFGNRRSEVSDLSLNFVLKSAQSVPKSSSGTVSQEISVSSSDNNAVVVVPQNTKISSSANSMNVYVKDNNDPRYELNHNNLSYSSFLLAIVYDFGPEGTTFEPAIPMTIKYDEALLAPGQDENDLSIAYYDSKFDVWMPLATTVDTENNILTASISHFSKYAIVREVVDKVEKLSHDDEGEYTGVTLECSLKGSSVNSATCTCSGGGEKVLDSCEKETKGKTSCECDCFGGEEGDTSAATLSMTCSGGDLPSVNQVTKLTKDDKNHPSGEPRGVIIYCPAGYTVANHTCECAGDGGGQDDIYDCFVQPTGELKGCTETYRSCDCNGGDDGADESIAYLTVWCKTGSTLNEIMEVLKLGNKQVGCGVLGDAEGPAPNVCDKSMLSVDEGGVNGIGSKKKTTNRDFMVNIQVPEEYEEKLELYNTNFIADKGYFILQKLTGVTPFNGEVQEIIFYGDAGCSNLDKNTCENTGGCRWSNSNVCETNIGVSGNPITSSIDTWSPNPPWSIIFHEMAHNFEIDGNYYALLPEGGDNTVTLVEAFATLGSIYVMKNLQSDSEVKKLNGYNSLINSENGGLLTAISDGRNSYNSYVAKNYNYGSLVDRHGNRVVNDDIGVVGVPLTMLYDSLEEVGWDKFEIFFKIINSLDSSVISNANTQEKRVTFVACSFDVASNSDTFSNSFKVNKFPYDANYCGSIKPALTIARDK